MAVNAHNYKGIYYEDNTQKYTDPSTGAHFKHSSMVEKLEKIAIFRDKEQRMENKRKLTSKSRSSSKKRSVKFKDDSPVKPLMARVNTLDSQSSHYVPGVNTEESKDDVHHLIM